MHTINVVKTKEYQMQEPKKVMNMHQLTKAVHELLDSQTKMLQLMKSMLQTNEGIVRSIQLITNKLTKKE